MTTYIFHNNYRSTLADTLLIAGTTANVVDAGALETPASGYTLLATITNQEQTLYEIIKITAVASLALAIERAQEGTTAREWPANSIIYCDVTAGMLGNMEQGVGLDIGGNAKGSGALELQSGRSADTQVASGANAVTIGRNNTASGARSLAAGYGSTASGQESIAVGDGASATDTGAVAVGDAAIAGATGATAVGDGATASGTFSVAAGSGASAAVASGAAIGVSSSVMDPSALTAWPATTAVSFGSTYRLAGNTGLILYCIDAGTTGATEPTPSGTGVIVDGTATFAVINVFYGDGSKAQAVGSFANAVGAGAMAIGGDSRARGYRALAFGAGAQAIGKGAIAIGDGVNAYGYEAIVIGSASVGDLARATPYITMINTQKYMAFAYASHVKGLEFVDQHDGWYLGSADLDETAQQTTKEVTLYSIPVQLGDAAWPGASETVKHGYSIRVGSYIYTAYIYNSAYFDAGTTGGTEPAWPTTPGDWVTDGDFDWICVGTSIEWLMPDYARFVPVSVGAITKWCTPGGSVTYPQITAGINGDLDKWLAATALSKLTGNYAQHLVDPTNTEGAKQFGIELTTAGTDLDCVAVLVVKGYVVESEVA